MVNTDNHDLEDSSRGLPISIRARSDGKDGSAEHSGSATHSIEKVDMTEKRIHVDASATNKDQIPDQHNDKNHRGNLPSALRKSNKVPDKKVMFQPWWQMGEENSSKESA